MTKIFGRLLSSITGVISTGPTAELKDNHGTVEFLLELGDNLSRPSHNLSGNGRAATSRDTGVTNQDLGASRGSDERLRAGRAW